MFQFENIDRDILEEIVIPENERVLTSKRYGTTAAGTVFKEIRVGHCDWCGRRLGERTVICCSCKRKLCELPSCAISLEGKNYCPEHAQQILPLTRLQFKILHGLIYELDLTSIRELARSNRLEFDVALNQLRVNGYVEKKGLSLFSVNVVSDRGILAWKKYQCVFGPGDVSHFIEEVQNHLKEVEHVGIERNNREGH